MTKFDKKKKAKAGAAARLPGPIDTEKAKDSGTPKEVPTSSKPGAKTFKPTNIAVVSKEQVGLLVTNELQKAMDECQAKVAQIIKGCRAANRRFR